MILIFIKNLNIAVRFIRINDFLNKKNNFISNFNSIVFRFYLIKSILLRVISNFSVTHFPLKTFAKVRVLNFNQRPWRRFVHLGLGHFSFVIVGKFLFVFRCSALAAALSGN